MLSIINHAAPNVVPGTNFNTQRFEELFAWITAMTADAARSAMRPHGFGLVTALDGKPSLQLEQTGNLLVLRRCAGITPAGQVVGIYEGITPILETRLERYQMDNKDPYQVLIEVDTTKLTGFGPQAIDQPERPAFTMPAYNLHVQPFGQTTGQWANAFPIGLLHGRNGTWELADYLPPCAHLGAHELLAAKYREYREAMKTMLTALPEIVRQTDTFRDKAMIELREFAMQCGNFLASRLPGMASLSVTNHPFDLLETWISFGCQTSFLLNCLTDRPGFYNLLYANTRSVNGVLFTTERLDNALHRLTNLVYDHRQVATSIEAVDNFLDLLVPVLKALGNGALQPLQSGYEEVRRAPVVNNHKTSFSTW